MPRMRDFQYRRHFWSVPRRNCCLPLRSGRRLIFKPVYSGLLFGHSSEPTIKQALNAVILRSRGPLDRPGMDHRIGDLYLFDCPPWTPDCPYCLPVRFHCRSGSSHRISAHQSPANLRLGPTLCSRHRVYWTNCLRFYRNLARRSVGPRMQSARYKRCSLVGVPARICQCVPGR